MGLRMHNGHSTPRRSKSCCKTISCTCPRSRWPSIAGRGKIGTVTSSRFGPAVLGGGTTMTEAPKVKKEAGAAQNREATVGAARLVLRAGGRGGRSGRYFLRDGCAGEKRLIQDPGGQSGRSGRYFLRDGCAGENRLIQDPGGQSGRGGRCYP